MFILFLNNHFFQLTCCSGLLKYAAHHKPKLIVLENVSSILRRTGSIKQDATAPTNSDWLESKFSQLGYTLNIAKVSSQNFLLPQRRNRVWMLAEYGSSSCSGWSEVFLKMALGPENHVDMSAFIQ